MAIPKQMHRISGLLLFLYFVPTTNEDVKGWEQGKSLFLKDYVPEEKNIIIVSGKTICEKSSPPEALVIVCSWAYNAEHRLAIRHTWAFTSAKKHNISVAFLVGQTDNLNFNNNLLYENKIYEDMIIGNFFDTYNNLTLKSILMLKWTTENCPTAKYLIKSDDDVYIRLDKLNAYIKSLVVDEYTKANLLHGSYLETVQVIRDPKSKWYVPMYMFPHGEYPRYLSGILYMMSLPTAAVLLNTSFSVKLLHLEDVFITGICADKSNIIPRDTKQFNTLRSRYEPFHCIEDDVSLIVYTHYIDPSDMHVLHSKILKCMTSSPKQKVEDK